MRNQLIQLQDGIYVEVEVSGDEPLPANAGTATAVKSSINIINPILVHISNEIAKTFSEIDENVNIDQAEIDLGFNFEATGNVYITKAKAASALRVKLTLKPR
ncbi:MAG: hypothetical protein F6K10_32025 [Moorea sp. SIO2B7]|nr:hypothetical protein [Moorena sp. SIO2B7]